MKQLNKKSKVIMLNTILITILFILDILLIAKCFFFDTLSIENQSHNEDVLELNLGTKKLQVADDQNPTILFGSDYQGEMRANSTSMLFDVVKQFVNPNLFVFCGDYQVDVQDKFYNSEQGILDLSSQFYQYFSENIPILLVQGNHDSDETYGLAETGIYESEKYIIYVLNEKDFPSNQSGIDDEQTVVNTANELKKQLENMIAQGNKKPIFISAHVPLHYSNRNNGMDNTYAKYLVDVLNEYGKKLDIIYLYGHNHSGNYDDYIGGSINYIGYGSSMQIGGNNESTNINFTYLNAGYISYSNNSISQTSTNVISLSAITVNSKELSIQKYTVYGKYYTNPIIVKLNNQ